MTPDAFFDALRADPADDTTRLVFADWLDDQGEADRADFIRVAVALERLPEDHPGRPGLLARYTDQRLTNGPRWLGPQPPSLTDVGYRGGLIDRAAFRPDAPSDDIEPFLVRHPIRELSISGKQTLREMAWSPALAHIRSLHVGPNSLKRRARLLDHFLDSPYLNGLQELSLSGETVDNHLAGVVAKAPALQGLVVLRLEQNRLDDAGIVRLLSPGTLPALQEWHVEGSGATLLSLRNLFGPERLGRWRALSWWEPRIGRPEFLREAPRCERLRRLNITLPFPYRFSVAPNLVIWLEGLSNLEELSLSGPMPMPLLAELAHLQGLVRLRRLEWRPGWLTPAERESARSILSRSLERNPSLKIVMTA